MAHTEFIAAVNDFIALLPMQIPDPKPAQPPGMGGVTKILGWLKWIGLAVVAAAIILGGAIMAFNYRQGRDAMSALEKILWPMVGAIVIGGGVAIVSAVMS